LVFIEKRSERKNNRRREGRKRTGLMHTGKRNRTGEKDQPPGGIYGELLNLQGKRGD